MMRIRDLRTCAGMTQRELADKLGISGAAVAQWETGDKRPTVDNLERLADIFGVTVDYILGRDTA